jgi:hypothetical protein
VNSRRVMESSKMVCVSLGEIALCKIKKITKTEWNMYCDYIKIIETKHETL